MGPMVRKQSKMPEKAQNGQSLPDPRKKTDSTQKLAKIRAFFDRPKPEKALRGRQKLESNPRFSPGGCGGPGAIKNPNFLSDFASPVIVSVF
jgi:hypothetical protein